MVRLLLVRQDVAVDAVAEMLVVQSPRRQMNWMQRWQIISIPMPRMALPQEVRMLLPQTEFLNLPPMERRIWVWMRSLKQG